MRLSMLPTLLREAFGNSNFTREPEPDLVMDSEAQVNAFAEAGRIDGVMSATYLFNTARISQVISGCEKVLDLGCGPATQLAQIAQLNQAIEFIGIDLSESMLENANTYCKNLGLNNVSFQKDDISTLSSIPNDSMDAVISTLALHHLPNIAMLKQCFQQVNRVLKPGGSLYLIDLSRLKSLYSILYFAYMNKQHQPPIFSLDYERSLRAAFSAKEIGNLSIEIFGVNNVIALSTFIIPILTIIKTPDKQLSLETKNEIHNIYNKMPKQYRKDLNDIRLFFKLNGLKNDPFCF